MPWFPKGQSTPITNMVCQLNELLGGTYFTVSITTEGGIFLYSLNLTNFGVAKRKYGYMVFDGALPYGEMFSYLQGLLLGYRAAKNKR